MQPDLPARASESALLDYLAEAEQAGRAPKVGLHDAADDAHLTDDFDALRWFELPQICLTAHEPVGDRTR